ncbi:MAG TPA: RNA polymerase sigma factor [Actinomycetota bacterium]|jgi:RNA polymerase sigma-70 factor (ECF subfamily)
MGDGTGPADAELWDRAVAGDSDAFGQLFDRQAQAIFAFCLRRTGDRAAAEDLMSTTFLHAWRRRAEMHPGSGGPVPWLYGIAANLVRRHLRSVGRRQAAVARLPLLGDEPDPSDGIAGRIDDARRVERTLEVLASLSEGDQELFALCVWQELSYDEVAGALGIPVGTVRSRLSRARGRLRVALGEPSGGSGDESGERNGGLERKEGLV